MVLKCKGISSPARSSAPTRLGVLVNVAARGALPASCWDLTQPPNAPAGGTECQHTPHPEGLERGNLSDLQLPQI